MPWHVRVTAPAERDIRKLPVGEQTAIRQAIDALVADSGSVHLAKPKGKTDEWRIRVGRWRVRLSQQNGVW